MDNAPASSVFAVNPAGQPPPTPAGSPVPARGPRTGPLPEPPALGAPPQASRAGALALSLAVCGGLASGALALSLVRDPGAAPRRTVAVSLEAFEPPPGPPPAPAATALRPAQAEAPRPAATPAEALPEAPRNLPERALAEPAAQVAASLPMEGGAAGAPGVAGSAPGGAGGGQPGGQAGGTAEGRAGGVLAPGFDAAYLRNPGPEYPLLSRRFGEEGRVVLAVLVSAQGLPDRVELRRGSGHPRLDQAALAVVRRWRFTPARRGTEALAAWVLVPLSFQLDA
jgi:periplasmic protein TonB